jgi:RNA polymerase sigma-70 factor (ECF subfamily)
VEGGTGVDGEDTRLIRLASSGDTAALQQLLLRYDERLLAYIDSRLPADVRQVYEPADVLQDTLCEAARSIGQFTDESADAFDRWLVTIARNRIVDLIRRHRSVKRGGKARSVSLPVGMLDDDSVILLLEQVAVYERTPSQSALSHETVATVQAALSRLPEDFQKVVRLRYLEGFSAADTGRRMGRTEGAIRTLCHRAVQVLVTELKNEGA